MKNIKTKFILIVITGILSTLPVVMHAASISASSTDTISSGDTSIINVFLDTEGKQINSIDGAVIVSDDFGGNFVISELSTANSAFTMWPSKPSLEKKHTISFVAGTPGGLSGNHLLIFKIIVKINQAGSIKISPSNITSYLNDGIPTPIKITSNVSTIKVSESDKSPKNKWEDIISSDNTAPLPFKIELIQDPYINSGKKYVHFETTDAESGISHYMVTEGDREPVRSGTDYVLIEQDNKVDIIVAAYDKAGNFQIATLKTKSGINWASIIIAVFIIYFGVKIIRKIIKIIKKKRDVQ